ncbi:hypothetical protein GCG21_08980 [Pseudactinotalea sp. HY160]|uniref:hypothetical protein n=1 Tax=Pseudactinotalea sp. HY160 TaxID=2654490 RepID=UPI00128BEF34|nr:hypothetical protein [Pseudactinotalea sp. HY160]MPV50136.1 hypothetical protein [Pseudactinotalea sp. HY160]
MKLSSRRPRTAASFMMVVTLVATMLLACTDSAGQAPRVVEQEHVRVHIPEGALPNGADLTVAETDSQIPAEVEGFSLYAPLAQGAVIEIDEGLGQPRAPLTLEFDVGDLGEDGAFVGVLAMSADGTVELIQASYSGGAVSAETTHLSSFWPVKIDLGEILSSAVDSFMNFAGITSPEPACTDNGPELDGLTFSVIQPAQAWLCLEEDHGALKVGVESNSPVPYVFSSSVPATFMPRPRLSTSTTVTTVVARALGFAGRGEGIIAPGIGTDVHIEAPDSLTLRFRQDPGIALLLVLTGVLDTIGISVDALDTAACFIDLVETAQALESQVGPVAKFASSLFSCAGEVLEISPAIRVVMAIITAGPQLFSSMVIGAVQEFTGASTFEVQVEASGTARIDYPGEETGRVTFDHPDWGRATLVTSFAKESDFGPGIGYITVFDSRNRQVWQLEADNNWYEMSVNEPPRDKTGSIFINWNPGRYNGVSILRPVQGGFEDFDTLPWDGDYQQRFYYAEVADVDGDEVFEVLLMGNDCDPSCAGGTTTERVFSWDGQDYVD